jgi:surfactin synthase thioesterase subunit
LNNVEFIEQMATYNGTPSVILENKELLELLLPMIRADFSLSEYYARSPIPTQLACPVIALASKQDEWLSKAAKELVAFLSDKILNVQD